MTNMRRGFTMIELIFVIVIIGILAAVAIPKMAGTAKTAKESTYVSLVGTLNRTVGPAMWASVVTSSTNPGSIKDLKLSNFLDLPVDVKVVDGGLTKCADSNATQLIKIATIPDDVKKDDKDGIYCKDGSSIEPPVFALNSDGNKTF